MKALIAMLPLLVLSCAHAAEPTGQNPAPTHRYLVERTFPAHALDGLNAETKKKVNANNASVGVRWIESFANKDKTKTYCVYEGPSEESIRAAAKLNGLPVDSVVEVPVTLNPR